MEEIIDLNNYPNSLGGKSDTQIDHNPGPWSVKLINAKKE